MDANGHKKGELRDGFGDLLQVNQYEGNGEPYTFYAKTRHEYDVLGNLTRILDAETPPNTTRIIYDTLSRRKEMIDPNMGHWY